jgi:hypothetical protein
MTIRRVVVLCLVVAVGACSSAKPKPAQMCVHHSECDPLACLNAKCQQECLMDTDCPTGTCAQKTVHGISAGVCEAPAMPFRECTEDTQCSNDQLCAPDGHCRPPCTKDAQCLFKAVVCIDGFCVLPSTPDLVVGSDGKSHFSEKLDGGPGGAGGADGAGGMDGGTDGADVASTGGGSGDAGDADAPDGEGGPAPARAVTALAAPALVRQGLGPMSVTITVTATSGLSNARGFSLDGAPADASVDAGVDGGGGADGGSGSGGPVLTAKVVADMSSDTMLVLAVSVPHGVRLGKKTLTFTSDGGPAYATDVLEVSAITAGPKGMDGNAGTSAAPFKTCKQSLAVADSGDTIQLLDGTYSMTGGEDWSARLPDKVVIQGQSFDGTVLKGSVNDGLVPLGDATIRNLTVQNFPSAMTLKVPGTIVLSNVVLSEAGGFPLIQLQSGARNSAITVEGTNTVLTGGGPILNVDPGANGVTVNMSDATILPASWYEAFTAAGDLGKLTLSRVTMTRKYTGANTCGALVALRGDGAMLSVDHSSLQQVGCGGAVLDLGKAITATLTNTGLVTHGTTPLIISNGNWALSGGVISLTNVIGDGDINIGVANSPANTLSIVDSQLSFSAGGISVHGSLTLTGATLDGPLDHLVDFSGTMAIVRGTTFRNYKIAAFAFQSGKVDFGTTGAGGAGTGDDKFIDIGPGAGGSAVGILDQRPPNSTESITCSGATFNGQKAPAGLITGPANLPPFYRIGSSGNAIQFN